jgi:predicted amidohydrolase YtcJ
LIIGALAGGCERQAAPDIILLNGKIFTCDPSAPWVEALAVRGDRVVAVGTDSAIRALAGSDSKFFDLKGHVVVPGFNDAHTHAGPDPQARVFLTTEEPFPGPTLRQVIDSLSLATKHVGKGEWLLAYVGPLILNDEHITRAVLDKVAPNNPVELFNFTGHGCLLNSRALEALGITESSVDPVGGWFVRDKTNGRLTGRLNGYLSLSYVLSRLAPLPDSTCVEAYRSLFDRALKSGITSIQDMASSMYAERTLRTLEKAGPPIRWRVIRFPRTDTGGRLLHEWFEIVPPANPMIRVSGTKWVLDGTQVEQLAVMRKPYEGKTNWYGRLYFPPDTIQTLFAEGLKGTDPLLFHAIGDSTISLILNTMSELASDSVWRSRRVRIEHANFMKPDQYERVKQLGIVIVTNPTHYEKVDPLRSLLEYGIPVAIGSDGPMNPFLNVMLAVTHGDNPAEAITREQAVVAYTRGSAYAEFAEHDKGVLAVGMLADLAVLSKDIFTIPAEELPSVESILTMVGGKVAYDATVLLEKHQ